MNNYPKFNFDEDAIIYLRDWFHLKEEADYIFIQCLYGQQEEENFYLYRDLENRQLSLGLVSKSDIDPNPQFHIDMCPDEGLEF